MAENVNEEVCEELIKEASIEELEVVAKVFGEELVSGNVAENEENLNEESTEKSNKTEDEEKGECFEFKNSTAEILQFADAEAKMFDG
ncbi:hypothetical protein Hanom_Chr16g01467881 [Helianthus anomalus]